MGKFVPRVVHRTFKSDVVWHLICCCSGMIFSCIGSSKGLSITSYDGVVIGGPVYAGKYPRAFRKWVKLQSFET